MAEAKAAGPPELAVDRHRHVVFPNRVREQRRRRGFLKLLGLSAQISDIPYIRLSKIERGEVVARADELVRIAAALDLAPGELLIDMDDPAFDLARWAEPFRDDRVDEAAERFAVKLGAAVRARRSEDRSLTIAALNRDYGLPPVILSRIENAQKTLDRWNAATVHGICRLLGARDTAELRQIVEARFRSGALDALIAAIADPDGRLQKMRARVNALRAELGGQVIAQVRDVQPRAVRTPPALPIAAQGRLLAVFGAPLPGGLIAPSPVPGVQVDAPRAAGPRAFGLRVCRPSLGPGLPAHGIAVVDPDVFPSSGGLAAIREGEAYRLVSITFDRGGAMIGHSLNPDLQVPLDGRDPADLAAVLSVVFP